MTVLRSGGEYGPEHVLAIKRQIEQWAPDARLQCLSDVDIPGVETTPLLHKWPRWWPKVELFRPDIEPGFLYTDLDNVIIGPIDDFFCGRYATQAGGWNALMYVPPGMPLAIYEDFCADPERWQNEFVVRPQAVAFGDAGYIKQYAEGEAWEQMLPGQVVNIVNLLTRWPYGYAHLQSDPRIYPYKHPAPGTRIVLCANAHRRPWKLKLFEHLYQVEEKA